LSFSIVLVIIGLIVGGVLAGQELIKQAQMRALITQLEQYRTAVMAFRDKYSALPGDMANATNFFGADPSCGGNGVRPYMATSNGLTCNGNGDGVIMGGYEAEEHLFWQHLSLEGLINGGPFTGTCGYAGANCSTNGYSWQAGLNAPKAAINRGAMITINNPDIEGGGNTLIVPQGGQHVFWLGGAGSADGSGNPIWSGFPGAYMVLTRDELAALDRKYDDGSPTSGYITGGFVQAFGTITQNNMCFDGTQTPPAYYPAGTYTGGCPAFSLHCTPMFKAGF
jgi:hypothetical protein